MLGRDLKILEEQLKNRQAESRMEWKWILEEESCYDSVAF